MHRCLPGLWAALAWLVALVPYPTLALDELHARLDANRDGAIDAREVEAARRAIFASLDRTGDGFVSRPEFDAAGGSRTGIQSSALFTRGDRNRDGRISLDEFMPSPGSLIARQDRNGDGRITADELGGGRQRGPAK